MSKTVLSLVLLAGTASLGWATPCTPGLMSIYTVPGFSCSIGSDTFSAFSYSSTASGGATAMPASGVTVTPEMMSGEVGFMFSAAWDVVSGQDLNSDMGYTVTAPSPSISGATLEVGPAVITGSPSGIPVQASETLSNGTIIIIGLLGSQATPVSASVGFGAPVFSLTVSKTIDVSAASGVTAEVSGVGNLFSASKVPEPGTLILIGTGLLSMLRIMRQKMSC